VLARNAEPIFLQRGARRCDLDCTLCSTAELYDPLGEQIHVLFGGMDGFVEQFVQRDVESIRG